MGKIIDFFGAKAAKLKRGEGDDLNDLLRHAVTICQEKIEMTNGIETDFQKKLERDINQKIIDIKMVSSGSFLCGLYVSQLFTKFLSSSPESWFAIDYLQKGLKADSASVFKEGGDFCFFVSSVFLEKAKQMGNYYQDMGIGFYYDFYVRTNKEIGYHMSQNFILMSELTRSCLFL
ncbi:MAG TPA: hypothetical protein PLK35_00795 [Candidatus Moranbacteria bacterium]|mgnify:CR=1 FL=1|nr:hypothetical protein [Candidatus Moranbacteria bacterium]